MLYYITLSYNIILLYKYITMYRCVYLVTVGWLYDAF